MRVRLQKYSYINIKSQVSTVEADSRAEIEMSV